ncbi:MAG: MFS transporter [Paludibacteraceae bacterium]|nr:MFS transporter [Paludibacteraceae bacterium]
MNSTGIRNPWLWVPTLYFAEGIPYFIVNNISVTMFTQLGVPNGEMALFTSLLYLPWTLKPLWSPFIDIVGTKRRWIVVMQALVAAMLIVLTLTLPRPDAQLIASHATPVSLFSLTLILFVITAFASATHDIAADGFYMLALTEHLQAAYVGLRSVFYRLSNIFCNSLLVFVAGWLQTRGTAIPLSWQYTLGASALLFTLLALWHNVFLPRRQNDKPAEDAAAEQQQTHDGHTFRQVMRDFGYTFVTFFRKPGILVALLFMLLFRLPEAFLLKMVTPFMLGGADTGGIGITLEQYSLIYGMTGVVSLLLGGVLGGLFAAKHGLRNSFWLMALAITLPDAVYLWLSLSGGTSMLWLSVAVAVEQFGYGFGFTAYMLYLMYFSAGERQTSHYALCTAFMALGMMLPGMVAGYVQEAVGYTAFFALVMVFCLVTLLVTELVRRTVNPQYGKKQQD